MRFKCWKRTKDSVIYKSHVIISFLVKISSPTFYTRGRFPLSPSMTTLEALESLLQTSFVKPLVTGCFLLFLSSIPFCHPPFWFCSLSLYCCICLSWYSSVPVSWSHCQAAKCAINFIIIAFLVDSSTHRCFWFAGPIVNKAQTFQC